MTTITNTDFASAIGVHFTMASRLRNGERKPGLTTVIRTMHAYQLTCSEIVAWLKAIDTSASASGAWLRANVFSRSATPLAS
jgi:hypothetical protein